MRKRIKRWVKRLLKTGGLFVILGIGALIGFGIGVESAETRQSVLIRTESPDETVHALEHHIEERIEQRIEERIVIPPVPPIPPIPPIPELPELPDLPMTIYVERSPSFFQVVNGIGTILASLGLIGLGSVMLVRSRRTPKEKSPDSLNN